jgi:hypothetical protein
LEELANDNRKLRSRYAMDIAEKHRVYVIDINVNDDRLDGLAAIQEFVNMATQQMFPSLRLSLLF